MCVCICMCLISFYPVLPTETSFLKLLGRMQGLGRKKKLKVTLPHDHRKARYTF